MDLSEYQSDRSANKIVEAGVPSVTKDEPCWLGIDEAGRGPVLGPMVYGTCFSPLSEGDKLKEMGFADSKTLTEEQREALFEKIAQASDLLGWIVHILSPNCISNSMLRRAKYNLNELSHDTAIGLIQRALDKGVNLKEVYVDTVGDPTKYQNKLKHIFPSLDITVAKKADATYPIVSAASICAKVARDRTVSGWEFMEGLELEDNKYGSGYPSDPATKKFLSSNLDPVFGFPNFVRFSWSTASNILEDKAVPVYWDDDDEDDDKQKAAKGTKSLTTFFQNKSDNSHLKKHAFFNDRCLHQVSGF